jgi:AbrB family looped-hinge helix DNA binding protein
LQSKSYFFRTQDTMQPTITSKGQITIPRDMRRHFGLQTGTAVCFDIEGDHIALRPAPAARDVAASGFGLIRSRRPAVPAEFDAASLAQEP